MKIWQLAGTTASIAIIAATGALADVTPEEVWQNWHDMASGYGQTVTTAGIKRDGDTLMVSGLSISMDSDGSSVSTLIDSLNFTDLGDGTVEITMSESYPLMFKTAALGEAPASEAKVTIASPSLVMTASGTPAAVSYDIKAPSTTITLDSIDGVAASAETAKAEAVFTNIVASYLVEGDTSKKTLASQFSADLISVAFMGNDSENGAKFDVTATIAELAGQSNGTLGASAMEDDLGAALKAGAAFDGNLSHGAMSFNLTASEGGDPTLIGASFGSGSLIFALNQDRMRYGVGGTATSFTMSGPDIPLPQLAFGYDEVNFDIDFPVATSDTPAPFTYLTKIVGLTISEDIWGMIDMPSLLPHDPATLILAAKGMVKVKGDIFSDPAMVETVPVDLESLDLTELKLSVAGAELSGSGALTFDNTDMVTYDGMPAPTGKIDLKLTGGNTLLDKIVELGYLSPDDVMGFRMMIAMVANSATDKDELTSSLEFKDKGFYANGQRLK